MVSAKWATDRGGSAGAGEHKLPVCGHRQRWQCFPRQETRLFRPATRVRRKHNRKRNSRETNIRRRASNLSAFCPPRGGIRGLYSFLFFHPRGERRGGGGA